jgi:hypothetical protein
MVLGQTITRKKNEISTSKILNPWPEQKRKAAQTVIKWDLLTYKVMKVDLESFQKEIDEEAAPSATDIRESVYSKSKEMTFNGGFNTSMVIGTETRNASDPTASKAAAIEAYRKTMYAATEYREMIRRIKAIETVLGRLDKSPVPDDKSKAALIRVKFFEQEKTDEQISLEFNVSRSTLFRWQSGVIYEIGKELGFIT